MMICPMRLILEWMLLTLFFPKRKVMTNTEISGQKKEILSQGLILSKIIRFNNGFNKMKLVINRIYPSTFLVFTNLLHFYLDFNICLTITKGAYFLSDKNKAIKLIYLVALFFFSVLKKFAFLDCLGKFDQLDKTKYLFFCMVFLKVNLFRYA